jgi:hypothetical protein
VPLFFPYFPHIASDLNLSYSSFEIRCRSFRLESSVSLFSRVFGGWTASIPLFFIEMEKQTMSDINAADAIPIPTKAVLPERTSCLNIFFVN